MVVVIISMRPKLPRYQICHSIYRDCGGEGSDYLSSHSLGDVMRTDVQTEKATLLHRRTPYSITYMARREVFDIEAFVNCRFR
jgi:hypothetical protein